MKLLVCGTFLMSQLLLGSVFAATSDVVVHVSVAKITMDNSNNTLDVSEVCEVNDAIDFLDLRANAPEDQNALPKKLNSDCQVILNGKIVDIQLHAGAGAYTARDNDQEKIDQFSYTGSVGASLLTGQEWSISKTPVTHVTELIADTDKLVDPSNTNIVQFLRATFTFAKKR